MFMLPASGAGGRWFESTHSDQFFQARQYQGTGRQCLSLNFPDTALADIEASDQAVLYPKNMAAHLVEQQVALEIACGQVDLDIRRSIRAD
jgi:hypothetical protein